MSTTVLVLTIAAATLLVAFVAFVAGVFAGCWLANKSWADDIQRQEQVTNAWEEFQHHAP